MNPRYRDSADRMRAAVREGSLEPALFRAALERVPGRERDGWVDRLLGIDHIAADGPHLPRGCSPYLPCPVDALLRIIEVAHVSSNDVFVDIGSGVGRAALLVRLLTGASAIGIEVQPSLVQASRDHARRLNVSGFAVVAGDAAELVRHIVIGTVFFLYCPFSGSRLSHVLDGLGPIAETRRLRVCALDLDLPARPWLRPVAHAYRDIAVSHSTLCHTGSERQRRHDTRQVDTQPLFAGVRPTPEVSHPK